MKIDRLSDPENGKRVKSMGLKLVFALGVLLTAFSQQRCNKEQPAGTCFKGRLEVKGICSNHTITVLEGSIDPATVEASWTDPNTGKTYSQVFALGSPCSFPASINEGDEFYFTLQAPVQHCAVCEAWYPKPSKALAITVLDKPCYDSSPSHR